MGRKRIEQLLEQLKENQQAELENAAAIYTVAKVAVNTLKQVVEEAEQIEDSIAELPAVSLTIAAIDKAELLRRYGSHPQCRTAAKKQGIHFNKNPSWEQLIAAFNQVETLRQLLKSHLRSHPCPELRGTTFQLTID